MPVPRSHIFSDPAALDKHYINFCGEHSPPRNNDSVKVSCLSHLVWAVDIVSGHQTRHGYPPSPPFRFPVVCFSQVIILKYSSQQNCGQGLQFESGFMVGGRTAIIIMKEVEKNRVRGIGSLERGKGDE